MSKDMRRRENLRLTSKQIQFATYYAETGHKRNSAQAAGYKYPDQAAQQQLDKQNVLDYVIELVKKRHSAEVANAHRTLVELMREDYPPNIRLKAADLIMNRSGYIIAQEKTIKHEITDSRSDEEIKQAILAIADELKLKTIEGQVVEEQPPAIDAQS